MNKYLIIILCLLAACSTKEGGPTGLMIEFIREPEQTLILDPNPEFTWVVPSHVTLQSAFQIQIASTRTLLKKNEADIWDSKKVTKNNSVEISYFGDQLSDNTNGMLQRSRGRDECTPCLVRGLS